VLPRLTSKQPFCLKRYWGRNGLDGSCEALAAYRVGHTLVKKVALTQLQITILHWLL